MFVMPGPVVSCVLIYLCDVRIALIALVNFLHHTYPVVVVCSQLIGFLLMVLPTFYFSLCCCLLVFATYFQRRLFSFMEKYWCWHHVSRALQLCSRICK